MSALEQMYQQVILDHSKRPHHYGLEAAPDGAQTGESHQVNPTCGDEVTLRVGVSCGQSHDLTLASVTWEGQGCSISQASTSIMTDLVTGQPLDQVERLEQLFADLMASRGKGLDSEDDMDLLDDATAFTGTSMYPARIKCALLGWMALKDALIKAG